MPPKKKAAKPPPKAVPRMPRRLPTSYTNAPLQPRRGWKGPPLPFSDIDGALAWGIGNEKLEEAQDLAGGFMVSDAHHRERAQVAEKELEGHSKRGARGRFVPRNTIVAEAAGAPDPDVIRVEPMAQNSRGRSVPARQPAPEAPKEEAPPASESSSKPEGTSAKPSVAKPEGTPAADHARRALEKKAEEARVKEDDFKEKMKQLQDDLAAFRKKNQTAKKAMPEELKERRAFYTHAGLKKLSDARVAAEKLAQKATITEGLGRRGKKK